MVHDTELSTRKEICQAVGRSWKTVESWIQRYNFPALMIDGRWESDRALIRLWRRKMIRTGKWPPG